VPGLGPKRALQLSRELGIASIADLDLDAAVRAGRLRGLSGFGARSEERILRGIGVITHDVTLRDALRGLPPEATEDEIKRKWAGSGGCGDNSKKLAVPADCRDSARKRRRRRLPIRRPDNSNKLDDWSQRLVTVKDLLGDFHTHTSLTDGIASLADMVAAAAARGYEYYAVADHAPNLVMQRMTDQKMLDQRAEARALADRVGLTLLHGTELNIAPDGSVDWEADFLQGFDIRVA